MLFFSIFLMMGLVSTAFAISAYMEVREVQDWPSTTGVVTRTGIVEQYDSGGEGAQHTYYLPRVQYTYQVDGATYIGSDVAKLETTYSSFADAQSYVEQHAVGSQVVVYYNPDNPYEAVLEKNSGTEPLIFQAITSIFVAIGAIGLFFSFRKWRSGAKMM